MNYNNDCHDNHHNDEQQQLDSSSPGNTPTPTGCTSPGPMMEVVRVGINIVIMMNHHTNAGCLHWDPDHGLPSGGGDPAGVAGVVATDAAAGETIQY